MMRYTYVRFQKKMRPVSLEIPEPDATAYQNLMRQNPKLTRSRATKFGRRLKSSRISRKAARTSGRRADKERRPCWEDRFTVPI
jgi:hypothetical protein